MRLLLAQTQSLHRGCDKLAVRTGAPSPDWNKHRDPGLLCLDVLTSRAHHCLLRVPLFTLHHCHPPADFRRSGGSGMNSIGQECTDLKKAYEDCFNSWFSNQFLHGSKEDSCASLFAVYQSCVKKAIHDKKIDLREIERNVLNTDNEKKPLAKSPPGNTARV